MGNPSRTDGSRITPHIKPSAGRVSCFAGTKELGAARIRRAGADSNFLERGLRGGLSVCPCHRSRFRINRRQSKLSSETPDLFAPLSARVVRLLQAVVFGMANIREFMSRVELSACSSPAIQLRHSRELELMQPMSKRSLGPQAPRHDLNDPTQSSVSLATARLTRLWDYPDCSGPDAGVAIVHLPTFQKLPRLPQVCLI